MIDVWQADPHTFDLNFIWASQSELCNVLIRNQHMKSKKHEEYFQL